MLFTFLPSAQCQSSSSYWWHLRLDEQEGFWDVALHLGREGSGTGFECVLLKFH